jgi:hypothetical protein
MNHVKMRGLGGRLHHAAAVTGLAQLASGKVQVSEVNPGLWIWRRAGQWE